MPETIENQQTTPLNGSARLHRTSLIIDKYVAHHATVLCAVLGVTQNKYIEDLVVTDLMKRGIDPKQPPSLGIYGAGNGRMSTDDTGQARHRREKKRKIMIPLTTR